MPSDVFGGRRHFVFSRSYCGRGSDLRSNSALAFLPRDQHLHRSEEVAVVRPFLAQPDQVVLEIHIVQAAFSEEFPDDGTVLLLDVRVVVLPVEPGSGYPGLAGIPEVDRNTPVHELDAVVIMDFGDLEEESPDHSLEGLQRVVLAPIPCRLDLDPLGLPVSERADPPEVVAHVATAHGHGVALSVSRRDVAGHDLFSVAALDGVEKRLVHPRTPVLARGSRLLALDALESAIHCGRAHLNELRLYGCRDVGLELLVLIRPVSDLGLEIGRAGASDGDPDVPEESEMTLVVCFSAALSVSVLEVPGQQPVDVLAGKTGCLADLVEKSGSFLGIRSGVRTPLRSDVFCCCGSRHVAHSSSIGQSRQGVTYLTNGPCDSTGDFSTGCHLL